MSTFEAADAVSGRPAAATLPLTLVALALVAIPYFLRLSLLETRGFNPDELEHLHWSWCVGKGMVPYRDYFDHHTPWLHFFMSRFFPLYDVDRREDDVVRFVFMARRWMWLFTGFILALTFALSKAWRERRTALVAVLLLSGTGFFLSKSLEFRPGVPASALLLGAVFWMLGAVRRTHDGTGGAAGRFFGSGLLLGAAIMFTQKTLFAGPGCALVAVWFLLDGRIAAPRAERFRLIGLQIAGVALPVALTMGYFAYQGALWRFIDFNFLLNTRWPGLEAGPFLVELVRQDRLFVLLAAGGLFIEGARMFRASHAQRGDPVVALSTLSLWATLPLHPAMSYQHFLLILPLTALYAAAALVRLVDTVVGFLERRSGSGARALLALGIVLAGVVVLYGVLEALPAREETLPPALLPLMVVTLMALVLLFWKGSRNGALALMLILLSVHPLERFRLTFDRGNWGTLQGMGYVLRNTAPWETTLDGFTGLGWFRPQAFFHHFQHPHAFALQSEQEHREMLDALGSGRAMPKLIFWSHYLREAVTQETRAFLEEHYVPTGLEPIRVRPFDNGVGWWSDEATRYLGWAPGEERAPHVLFEYGWREPGVEYGLPVRRTRTRRSKLIVPIRYPRDFKILLRARADTGTVPFAVEMVVNGSTAGVVEAVPRWQDYAFDVTIQQLRPGFNEFELRFSAADDSEERPLELAAHSLKLTPITSSGR